MTDVMFFIFIWRRRKKMPKQDIVKRDEEGIFIELHKGVIHCPRCKGSLIEAEFGTTATPENTVEGYICEEECGFEEIDPDIVRAVKLAVKTDAPTSGYLYVGDEEEGSLHRRNRKNEPSWGEDK
jgi:hypothetical protein